MVLRAVFLDFGGTLADGSIDWDSYYEALLGLLRGFGHSVEMRELRRAMGGALSELERARNRNVELTFEEIYASALTKLGVHPEDEALLSIHATFRQHYRSDLYPCVEEVLEALSRRYELALISNTMSDNPRRVLERANLLGYFRVAICSRDLGIRKPDPRIFEQVLREVGVESGEAAHVGDSVEQDMIGASNAGLIPIWVRNEGSEPWPGYAISSICELPEFMNRLEEEM
jgi:HAD superfamily hydrolase (TIGR01549 family)